MERETIAERIRDNMHELAKTGRWLGGTTPTGFESEAIKSITVDGKTKKACKLKLVPEEADIVKTIFDLYVETDSLTLTEAALIKQGSRQRTENILPVSRSKRFCRIRSTWSLTKRRMISL